MNRSLMFVVIVVAVSFTASFLFSFAITAAGGTVTDRWAPVFIGLSLGAVAGAIALALKGNRKVAMADGAARTAALRDVQDGGARLLVVRQGFVGKLAGVDVAVDGTVRTQLKSPRFAALALAPGRHAVTASVQGKTTDPVTLDLAPGETAALRIEVGLGKVAIQREADVVALRTVLAGVPMVAS